MTSAATETFNDIDDAVDVEIAQCLKLEKPISFFLFAGAGSGKTRSLVNALRILRDAYGSALGMQSRRVAVITYTNAACDEIKHRLDFDPLIEVSTIHSFVWTLIGGYNADIRAWLRVNLAKEISELEEAQRKGRAGKAADEREKSITSKQKRLASLDSIIKFVYSPTGDNRGRDSLNHSEVISISSDFLHEKPVLQSILINRYPFLLIDESQDTNKHLIDALLAVQRRFPDQFAMGLFGDMMQRIYADGKVGLAELVPPSWAKPAKRLNHRCPKRIVRLINKIRSSVDSQEQVPRSDKPDGFARCFVLPQQTQDKFHAESLVAARMAQVTGDDGWKSPRLDFKTLTLEHHMAARRMGFLDVFEPLYKVDQLRTGLLDGSLPGLRFFTHDILPLLDALKGNDHFSIAGHVRKRSPLLDKSVLREAGAKQLTLIEAAQKAVQELWSICQDKNPSLLVVLNQVAKDNLFEVPEALKPFVAAKEISTATTSLADDDGERNEVASAWSTFLAAPLSQARSFSQYVSGTSQFATHQGVKGLEFPRVMVIMDDEEARGFLFSYDKLFGAKPKTDHDRRNESAGNETGIDRTKRLFYVTCSRAEESLAIVAYSANPAAVKRTIVDQGWFDDSEVELLTL